VLSSQAPLFQPDQGHAHTAVLACGHRRGCPPPDRLPKRHDGWHKSLHCDQCGRAREIVSILNPAADA